LWFYVPFQFKYLKINYVFKKMETVHKKNVLNI
jgi:hypothetical protein